MVLGKRPNPYAAFNFEVMIGGLITGGFQEVSGLDSSVSVESYQEGGLNGYQHRLIGPAEPAPNLVLKRGLTDGLELWFWYQVVNMDIAMARIRPFPMRVPIIIFLNSSSGEKLHWWLVRGAVPVKWSGPRLQADASGSSAIAFETLELANHGVMLQGKFESEEKIKKLLKG